MNSYMYQDKQNTKGSDSLSRIMQELSKESQITVPIETDLMKKDILFFRELLSTPNLDKETIKMANETIRGILNRYNNPTVIFKYKRSEKRI